MAFSLRFLVLAAALVAATAFAPVSQTQQRPAVQTAVFSSIHHNHDHNDENEANPIAELAPLALKMAGVLTIKTVKDVVNYPPQLFDQFVRKASGVDQTNPAVLLAKLMGVLLFKFAHDAVYYPMIWTQRLIECNSLDECDVE